MRDSPCAHDEDIGHKRLKHPCRSALLRRIQREDLHAWKCSGELLERLGLSRHGKHSRTRNRSRGHNGAPQTPAASDDDYVLAP